MIRQNYICPETRTFNMQTDNTLCQSGSGNLGNLDDNPLFDQFFLTDNE